MEVAAGPDTLSFGGMMSAVQTQCPMQPMGLIIPEFVAYKATRLSDIVCRRTVKLYSDRIQTVHQQQQSDLSGNEKTWYLDKTCKLEPEYVQELVAEKRTVRPPGQWTVTAKLTTVTGQAQEPPIDLYCVTIHWPTSWLATKGYTSFTLGFETAEEAAQWHALVQRQLSVLRVRAVSSKGDSSTGHSSKPSYDEGLGCRSAGSGNGTVGRKTSQGFVAAALEHFWSSGSGIKDDKQLHAVVDGCDQGRDRRQGIRNGPCGPQLPFREPGCPQQLAQQQRLPGCYPDEYFQDGPPVLQDDGAGGSFTSTSTDVIDGTARLLQQSAAGQHDEQRWVPYRHTNGVAIYHHKASAAACSLWSCGQDVDAGEPAGSEYMASSIVRGCPDECLSVLVDLSSNTTILGPASRIELLEDGEERQVLRLTVEATGMARRLCAPREVIVERLFKREECGVDVILFSSCEEPPVTHSASGIKRQRPTAAANGDSSLPGRFSPAGSHTNNSSGGRSKQGSVCVTATAAAAAVAVAACAAWAAGSWLGCLSLLLVAAVVLLCGSRFSSSTSRFQSLWYKPVRAHVQGGYTISPREDCFNAINSPECLVTCILKVDLRGFLGERSWLRPILDALGWVDAYVERMLMAVILVKDEVEQQRFMVQPFSILTNNHAARASSSMVTATSAAGSSAADADDSQEAATLREGFSQHLRQQQLMRQRRRQLALQQQQQQQQMAHMQRSAVQAGFSADDAARLAAAGYWGSGVTGSQAGMLRGPGTGMYGQQGANGLLGAPGYGMQWPYKGPLIGTMGGDGGYSRQQQEMLMQGAEGGVQLKRGSSQGRQQGRLGRMASRIYALRPRLRKGDSGGERSTLASAGQAASAGSGGSAGVAAGLYSSLSASFKNGLAALTSADAAAASDAAAPTAEGVPAAAAGGADGAEAQAAATDASDSAQQLLDLSDTPAVLASLGLPQDSVVVGPQYYIGGPQGPAAKYSSLNPRYWSELHVPGTPAPFKLRAASYLADRTKVDAGMPQFVLGSVDLVETARPTQHISRFLPAVRCNNAAYSFVVNLIIPGTPVLSLVAVFINEHHPDILDGPPASTVSTVGNNPASKSSPALVGLQDKQPCLQRLSSCSSANNVLHTGMSGSTAAGGSMAGMHCSSGDAGAAAGDTDRVSRYETPVGGRPGDAGSEDSSCDISTHRAAALARSSGDSGATGDTDGSTYQRPRDVNDWQPFDFALHRFLHGGPQTRQAMFKLIPHIAEGSWVIKQSVGTVPVILGNKLQTVYYQTDRYIEATVDVTSSSAAAYITGMVRGATKSLVIDLGFVLEGQRPEELPEALLGAFRLNHLDCTQAKRIDTTQELPLLPRPLQQHQLAQMAGAVSAVAAGTAGDAVPPTAARGAAGAGGVEAAAAATGLAVCKGDQRRVCSASGAMPGGMSVTAGKVDRPGQQQQQQQPQLMPQIQQQQGGEQGQARAPSQARNSASVLEAGRTMTGHARSRSAASAEELYLSSGLFLAETVQHNREQRAQQAADQQQPSCSPVKEGPSSSSYAGASTGPAAATATGDAGSAHGDVQVSQGPPSIKTSVPEAAAAEPAQPGSAADASGGQSSAAGGVPSAARQLFGSLLPFGSSGLTSSQQERPQSANKAAAAGASTSLYAYGAVSSLSGSSTPTAASAAAAAGGATMCSPRNLAAAAGSAGLLVNTGAAGGSSSHHSGHHFHRSSLTSTPTAAAAAAAAAAGVGGTPSTRTGQHHRTSGGTSDAASRTPAAPSWPASPPAAEYCASKLSAAAFISRAHAAALAASAQRRGQRAPSTNAAGAYGASPAGFSSMGSAAGLGSSGGEQQLYGSGPANGSLAAAPDTDSCQQGGWQVKKPRASSTGLPEAASCGAAGAPAALLEQFSSVPVPQQEGLGSGKISATEQLRLTHSALRASATGGGVGAGGGLGHQGVSASLPTSNSVGMGPFGRQSSTIGGPAAADNSGSGQLTGQPSQQQAALLLKRRVSNHRRYASMGAMQ